MNRNNLEEDISCNNRSINRIRLSRWMTKSNCFYSLESLNFAYFSLLIFETPVAYLCHFVNVGPTFPDIIFFSRDDSRDGRSVRQRNRREERNELHGNPNRKSSRVIAGSLTSDARRRRSPVN